MAGILLLSVVGLLLTSHAHADVALPSIFSDHMVLQRGEAVPVWGFANAGEAVTVSIGEQSESATADDQGRWRVDLAPMEAGGPWTVTVKGMNTLTIEDVYVGEVWLCSGQSNMEWPVKNTTDAEAEVLAANWPMIRMYTAERTLSAAPQNDVAGAWRVCTPETVRWFSAVGYYFGRMLHQELDVPVGMVHSSWGGSRAEPWVPRETLLSHPKYAGPIEEIDRHLAAYHADKQHMDAEYQALLLPYQEHYTVWRDQVTEGGRGLAEGWAAPDMADDAWQPVRVPGPWEAAGVAELASYDGVLWLTRTVEIPEAWAGQNLLLSLGPVDDLDITFFNGEEVGRIGLEMGWYWAQLRRYAIPGEQVKSGTSVITVRVADISGLGGFTGEPEQMTIEPVADTGTGPFSLAGEWRYRLDTPLADFPERPVEPKDPAVVGAQFSSPAAMFNGMLHPLVPYGLRGAIWYQGESNAGEAEAYRELLPLMIQGWRDVWNKPDMPFGNVQLANYKKPTDQPGNSSWAELRDAQLHTFKTVNHTGMAVIIDIGEAFDIHPKNKQDVGRRLGLWALSQVYGQQLVWSGPVYQSMRIEDGKVYVKFGYVGGGLQSYGDGALQGFSIAGADGVFVWAEAEVVGDEVVVFSDEVAEPAVVRYAWADNPDKANLINAEGLPASPFQAGD
jgi:sialate O-acetylesterase